MADKDFKVKNGIDVAGNANIDGNLNAAKYQDSAPSSPVNGQLWVDSDAVAGVLNQNDYLLKSDFEVIGTPIGGITQYAGSTSPSANWSICDGTAVSRSVYATLFARIGTTYGVGDNSTTFNLPNLKGRVPVGLDSTQTEFDALGETGGANTVTLTSAQSGVPAHSHANTLTDPTHSHIAQSFLNDTGSGANALQRANVASGDISFNSAGLTTSESTGVTITNVNNTAANAASAHNNLQPYIVLNYIIKT
jgi:microcystin-dependent protein